MTKRTRTDHDSPLRIGPFVMRLGPECDPRLRQLSDEEAVEEALALMALSLNLLWESVTIELKTKDERRIDREVSKLLAEFDRLGRHWREEGTRVRGHRDRRANH